MLKENVCAYFMTVDVSFVFKASPNLSFCACDLGSVWLELGSFDMFEGLLCFFGLFPPPSCKESRSWRRVTRRYRYFASLVKRFFRGNVLPLERWREKRIAGRTRRTAASLGTAIRRARAGVRTGGARDRAADGGCGRSRISHADSRSRLRAVRLTLLMRL